MDSILTTPRLKLTLITHAEKGSEELNWLHELRSNKQTTAWSIYPPSITLADTEKIVSNYLPSPPGISDPAQKSYKIAYAIHDLSTSSHPQFIGLVNLASLSPGRYLPLPAHLVIPKEDEATTLVTELAYSFLPHAWGKGYATEAVTAVLRAASADAAGGFWKPWEKVWVRVIVNGRNPASLKVMRKMEGCGVGERGVFEWKGEKIFIGGEWRGEDDLYIFGGYLRE